MHEVVPGARATGQVLLDAQDIYHGDVDAVRVRRRVGMVFQKPNPFPTMSIRDNVLAGLRLNGERPDDPDAVVEKMLQRVALWDEVKDILGRGGTGLSGGQQQRLCIARSLALEPEVLLMDEPCSALDPIATARVEELIHELRKSYTIVIVTHNMQQAARVANFTAFFYLGKLIRTRSHRRDLHAPQGTAHGRLHHGSLRLRGMSMDRRHTDREYEGELESLRERVLLMGAHVEEVLALAMRAYTDRNVLLAKGTIELDSNIDQLELEIDEAAINILARRQPVASDLRFITHDLEVGHGPGAHRRFGA